MSFIAMSRHLMLQETYN